MIFANNEGFGHSQFGAHPSHFGFFAEILTKYLQLHWLYSDGSQFENCTESVSRPSGLI